MMTLNHTLKKLRVQSKDLDEPWDSFTIFSRFDTDVQCL